MRINIPMVLRVIGWLLMIEGGFMLFPLITSYIFGDTDVIAFLISTLITLSCGALLTFRLRPKRTEMGRREGFLLTALVWVVFSLFGMLPFLISDIDISITDAYYEAMSGFTTTGCSIIGDVESLTHGLNLWRCLMQWIGGMGIILFTLAILPMLNHSGGVQMFNAEVTGITHERLRPRISQTAKSLWGIYFTFTGLLIFTLWLGKMPLFDSICHAFSTISTGGFSTRNASLSAWDSVYIDSIIVVFMFLGGTNFALIYKMTHGHIKSVWENSVFRTYIFTIIIIYVLFVISILVQGQYTGWQSVTLAPLFQVISTITSTGLIAPDFYNWGALTIALIFIMMFSGACAGSTSGGAKLDRVLVLFKSCRNELYKCVRPNAVTAVRISDKVVSNDIVTKVVAFICIYILVIIAGALILTALEVPVIDAFFTTFSCVCNTGFSADITGYGNSIHIMPDAAKWILSFMMLIGRLELFTVLILFTSAFWKK
ncbi:MAG: TrkH family potassium uptake protein [Paramuribaculum sp.]|nr:TrkH family potassium uptake protein [Paramuribaculum sp.]